MDSSRGIPNSNNNNHSIRILNDDGGNNNSSDNVKRKMKKKSKKKRSLLEDRIIQFWMLLIFQYGLFTWYWMSPQVPATYRNQMFSSFVTNDNNNHPNVNHPSIGGGGVQGIMKKHRLQVQLTNYFFDKSTIVDNDVIRSTTTKVLSAHAEEPMKDEIKGTGSFVVSNDDKKDVGVPPEFIVPLPLRTNRPNQLQSFHYPRLKSCQDVPAKLPVDAGLLLDENGNFVYPNTHRQMPDDENDPKQYSLQELAKYCPVDIDPFLPWIHDVFPSTDGTMIHFVAQNKRRCNTGKQFETELNRLRPQVTIMQPVSVKRITPSEALNLAPDLWSNSSSIGGDDDDNNGLPRYRLAPYEEADEDAQQTRFICRFHAIHVQNNNDVREVIVGETLSTFPFNYELVNSRKTPAAMLTPRGKDNKSFWLSNFKFNCPVPDNGNLQQIIASGDSVLDDGTPTVYVDVIPIRTSPRFGNSEAYLNEDIAGPKSGWRTGKENWKTSLNSDKKPFFDAKTRWGDKHVLPMVEASGRWENIPVCKPPPPTTINNNHQHANNERKKEKPHKLVACVWASKTFATRGGGNSVGDTSKRLIEWLEFHLLVGFDHIYIYDNTGANTNETSLEEITNLFSDSEVTRIDWPSRVCNNNVPASPNTGERSSQYAAENSCLQRYGQYTEWMASFDTDEYLIPMGENKDLKEVLAKVDETKTKILSFKSTRAYADIKFTQPYFNDGYCGNADDPLCVEKKEDALFLETYNCDFIPLPKPGWADRARKQIYRTDYVRTHFVHYSTITNGHAMTYKEAQDKNLAWKFQFSDWHPTERTVKENSEAVMLHSKTTSTSDTRNWKIFCKLGAKLNKNQKCRVGFPFPNNIAKKGSSTADGYEHNCYTNTKLTDELIPRLKVAMQNRLSKKNGESQ